jgi:hypothetical protein
MDYRLQTLKDLSRRKRRNARIQEVGYASQGNQIELAARRQRLIAAKRNYQAAHEQIIRPYGNNHPTYAGRDRKRRRPRPIPRTYGQMARGRVQRGSSYS